MVIVAAALLTLVVFSLLLRDVAVALMRFLAALDGNLPPDNVQNRTRFTKRSLATPVLLFIADQRSRRRWKNAYCFPCMCLKSFTKHARHTLPFSVYFVIQTQNWGTGLDETSSQGITQK